MSWQVAKLSLGVPLGDAMEVLAFVLHGTMA